ncbi:MAG TPA: MFS transporter, partial [Rhodobacter sp.]|nr:MFS transporter [Rhodobacter sp.]
MSFFTFLRTNIRFLAAGMLLAFLSGFGQTFFISLFGPEIRETFGLSYAQWGISYALATTASAVVMIWAGGLTDRLR